MEFRFPGWGASLHERSTSQACAHPSKPITEAQPAWRHDDLDDLSGDEEDAGALGTSVAPEQSHGGSTEGSRRSEAVNAALACRALRESALSDELWSAWSGGREPAAGSGQPAAAHAAELCMEGSAGSPAPGCHYHVAKAVALAERTGRRFPSLVPAHEDARRTAADLYAMVAMPVPTGHEDAGAWCRAWQESVLTLQRALLQLTRFDWSATYDMLVVACVHAADMAALSLHARMAAAPHAAAAIGRSDRALDAGASLWEGVLGAWRAYRRWAAVVLATSERLAECVSAEHAAEMMARGDIATPSLGDATKAAFRGQVLLAFGLRGPLQASLLASVETAAAGGGAGGDWALWQRVRALLHELDAPDDRTAAVGTRSKLRLCFGLEPGAGELVLSPTWPLRVPALT
ncbi:hypothetical protein WJX81_005608 [Elliptochloris bilobata]|uniref:Uncharacterized protein n=1 Tax=Elliptochloris bilobata TaxID=381761 RepID=A0AAW1REU9_9CHLO